MTAELYILGWTLVLALVQILLVAQLRTRETGLKYVLSSRDKEKPMGVVTARLSRAQANLFETLPLFAGAILIAHLAGRESQLTLGGAWLYFVARLVYVPLYAFGVPVARSAVWGMSLAGLICVFCAIL